METFVPRITFFIAPTFAILYSTNLIGISANYCVHLDNAFYQQHEMCSICSSDSSSPTSRGFKIDYQNFRTQTSILKEITPVIPIVDLCSLCDNYAKWRSCSIVGMFVGTLILLFTIGRIYQRYSRSEFDHTILEESEENPLECSSVILRLVAGISIIMITTVFSVLVHSQASVTGYEAFLKLKTAAVAEIAVLGVGVAVPTLGIIIVYVLVPCVQDFTDALRNNHD